MRRDLKEVPVAKAAPWTDTDTQMRKRGSKRDWYPGSPRRKRCLLGGCGRAVAFGANALK